MLPVVSPARWVKWPSPRRSSRRFTRRTGELTPQAGLSGAAPSLHPPGGSPQASIAVRPRAFSPLEDLADRYTPCRRRMLAQLATKEAMHRNLFVRLDGRTITQGQGSRGQVRHIGQSDGRRRDPSPRWPGRVIRAGARRGTCGTRVRVRDGQRWFVAQPCRCLRSLKAEGMPRWVRASARARARAQAPGASAWLA